MTTRAELEIPTIEAVDLALRFGDTRAVDGMSFTLEGGRIYGLLGRNGSGKSSLLSLLAAFRQPTTGEVLVSGRPLFEDAGLTSQICLIRESGDLDSLDHVHEAMSFAELSRPYWDREYAARLLDSFQVSPEKSLSSLSRGQRAAVAITLGLASRAPITMFDESYLGLDAPSRYFFYEELLKDFMAFPRTVIISTHLIEEVASLFEEVLIIDKGKLLMHDSTDALRLLGSSVTGPAERVDQLVQGQAVLGTRQLGGTKSVVVFGKLDEGLISKALSAGIDISPIGLQDLFVYMTDSRQEVLS